MLLFSHSNLPLGLDISEGSLKLVGLTKTKKGLEISSLNEIKLPPGLIVASEIKEKDKLIKIIKNLLKEARGKKITTKKVVSCLPEPKTFIKLINIKKVENNQLEQAINNEISRHIPVSLNEIYLDWQIISEQNNYLNVIVGVAPKKIVEEYTDLLKDAKLLPLALEIEAQAITRALIRNDEKEMIKNLAILDLGATRSSFIAANNKKIFFSISLPTSGLKITKTIAGTLKIKEDEAEQIKIKCGFEEKGCQLEVKNIMIAAISQITSNIKESLAFFENHFTKESKAIDIILCGGGANLLSIEKMLSEKLGLNVNKANPLTNVILSNKLKDMSVGSLLPFTTAIGLALRYINSKMIKKRLAKNNKTIKEKERVPIIEKKNMDKNMPQETRPLSPTPIVKPENNNIKNSNNAYKRITKKS